MTKLKRFDEDGAVYFVTTVTYNREPIFNDEIACKLLLTILAYQKLNLNFSIYAFVIMPDHIHMIVHPQGKHRLSDIMKRVKGNFARFYKKKTGLKTQIWQHRFFDEGIRGYVELRKMVEYVHNNPVTDGIAPSPGTYKFSSYNYYHGSDELELVVDNWEQGNI